MDKYLEAIEKETEKEKLLNTKKCEIIESNKRRENLEKEKKRKHYLQNKEFYLKEYFKKSIAFGIKVSISFVALLLGIKGFESFLYLDTFSLSISQLLSSFFSIGGMMFLVEFQYVAKEFLSLTYRYHGNVDSSIDILMKEIESIEKKRKMNQERLLENQVLLKEIGETLLEIQEKIAEYQNNRNQLIGNLTKNLDRYIHGFQFISNIMLINISSSFYSNITVVPWFIHISSNVFFSFRIT